MDNPDVDSEMVGGMIIMYMYFNTSNNLLCTPYEGLKCCECEDIHNHIIANIHVDPIVQVL